MKNVSPINDGKDIVTKDFVDNITNAIYTSSSDDFNDSTKIATNPDLVLDTSNSVIRPKITNYTANLNEYNDTATSQTIDVSTTNGVRVVSGDVGFDPVASSNNYNVSSYISEPFQVQNATSIRITPAITNVSHQFSGWSAPIQKSAQIGTSDVEHLTASIKASNVDLGYIDNSGVLEQAMIVTATMSMTNVNSPVLVVRGASNTHTANVSVSGLSLNSDTNIRNLAMASDGTYVYVAYPSSASQYKIRRYLYSDLSQVSSDELTIGVPNGTSAQKIDLAVQSGRLHIIGAFGTSTTRVVHYFYRTISGGSWGTTTTNDVQLTRYDNTTSTAYTVKFCSAGSNKLGWVAFVRGLATTNPVHFGIVDTTSSTTPFQFRTGTGSGTAPTCASGVTFFNTYPSGGVGTMIYDDVNDAFVILYTPNTNAGLYAVRIGTLVNSAFVNNFNSGSAPFTSMSNRDMVAFMTPSTATAPAQRNFDIVFANNARQDLFRANMTISSAGVLTFTANSTVTLFDDISGTPLSSIELVPEILTSSSWKYNLYYRYNNSFMFQSNSFSFDHIRPILNCTILDTNLSAISSKQIFQDSQNFMQITLTSSTNNAVVDFDFSIPIMKSSWTSGNRSLTLTGYTIEQTAPAVSVQTSGTFTSTDLITDRIVKEVTLDVSQTIPSVTNNAIAWEVASLGDSFIALGTGNTSNAIGTTTQLSASSWKVVFNENYYGSRLRVKATMTKGANANTLEQVPRIDKYVVNVPNTVMYGDILPMQISLMKLGLQVTTLTTANRWGYKNMMIDVFQTDAGVLTYAPNFTYSSGTFTNSTGTTQTLTSSQETTDIANVTSIIVVGDGSNGVLYDVRRGDNGTWTEVTPEQVYTFADGTPTNKLQIRARVPAGASITGWAYLYA